MALRAEIKGGKLKVTDKDVMKVRMFLQSTESPEDSVGTQLTGESGNAPLDLRMVESTLELDVLPARHLAVQVYATKVAK